MSTEAVRVVTSALESWGDEGPGAGAVELTPDCEIDLTRALGPYRGDQANSLHAEFLEHWGARELELGEPIDAGEYVVVPFTDRFGGRDGIAVEATGVWVGTVRDGALTRLCLYQTLDEALAAAGLPPDAD